MYENVKTKLEELESLLATKNSEVMEQIGSVQEDLKKLKNETSDIVIPGSEEK